MAVTYEQFYSTVPLSVDTASLTVTHPDRANRVTIAMMHTFGDVQPTHDRVWLDDGSQEYDFTKIKTYTYEHMTVSIWYYIGLPVGSGKTLYGKLGGTPKAEGFKLSAYVLTNAYQQPYFSFITKENAELSISQQIASLSGAIVLTCPVSTRVYGTGYATISMGAGQTNVGQSAWLPYLDSSPLTRYQVDFRGSYEVTSALKVDTSFTVNQTPDTLSFTSIIVMSAENGWAPPWVQQEGEYIEPPCGYFGQVLTDDVDLSHLEGQVVSIYANGDVLDQQVVENGTIVLSSTYSLVHIGLPFYSDLQTLNIEVPMKEGTMQSLREKINNVTFSFKDSRGGFIGPDEDHLWEAFKVNAIRQGAGINLGEHELFTGDIRQPLGGQYGQDGCVFFRQSDPLPVTIGAIIPEVSIGGKTR